MSTPRPPASPESNHPPRRPILAERVFLDPASRLRPIFRVVLFIFAVLLLNEEVGSLVFTYTNELSLWYQFFWNSVALVITFLFLSWFFIRFIDGRPFSSLGLSLRRGWAMQFAAGFGIGVVLQLLVMAVLIATRSIHYSGGVIHDLHFWNRVAGNAALFAFAATVEELAFRGYAFQRLVDALGTPAALVASSVIFGLGHIGNPSATLFSTINTILAGLLLALPYVRTRSMWMQIGLHWSWNLAMATIVSLPVSGLNFGPTFFTTRDSGPSWITGSHYGPEGGAVVTIISIAAILWFILTPHLTPSPAAQEDLQ